MLNPATHIQRDEFNEFTRVVWQLKGSKMVRLRNGTFVQPIFKPAEDETCNDAFFTEDYKYCWNLDGTSVTNSEYDMMEILL